MLSAGIEYAKGREHRDGAQRRIPRQSISRGRVENTVGLANVTDFHTFSLAYTRQINPNLSVNGLIGLVGTTGAFTLGLPKTLLPIYTLSTNVDVYAKAGAECVRVKNDCASDDSYR